ncbi:MAG: AAA family ATPase [Bacillota bacterium]|nr:AAA family ATPase [Bacillota bacterium]
MRILRARIHGFGRFRQREFIFGPGLNLILGPNESGKTTLQRFIRAMLYGLKKYGVSNRQKDPDYVRYQPWAGQEYGGILWYEAAGRQYRVERNLDWEHESIRLWDEVTGEELTARYPMDRRREVLFAAAQLGLSQLAFDNTVCIRQLEASELEREDLARELADRLISSGEGPEEISVRRALAAVDRRLEELGGERALTKEYGAACQRVERLERELQEWEEARQEVLDKEEQLHRVATQEEEVLRRLEGLRRQRDALRLCELRERLRRLSEAEDKLQQLRDEKALLERYRDFPAQERDRLWAIEREVSALRQQLADLQGELEHVEEELARGQERRQASSHLDPFRQEDIAALHQVCASYWSLQDQLRQSRAQLAALEEQIARLKGEEEAFSAYRPWLEDRGAAAEALQEKVLRLEAAGPGQLSGAIAAAALSLLLAAASGLSLWQSTPRAASSAPSLPPVLPFALAAGAAAAAALALSLWWKRRQNSLALARARAELATLLSRTGAKTMAEFRRGLERLREIRQAREAAEERQRQEAERLADLASRGNEKRAAALAPLRQARLLPEKEPGEAGEPEPSEELLSSFTAAVQGHLELLAGLERLCRRQAELQEKKGRLEEALRSQEKARLAILQAAGVPDREAFEVGWRSHQELLEKEKEERRQEELIREILGGETAELLSARAEELAQKAGAREGESPADPAALRRLEEEIAALKEQAQELGKKRTYLATYISTSLAQKRPGAEIRHELEHARAQLTELAQYRSALLLARELLTEVGEQMHREFAPLLSQKAGELIARLTGHRYTEVKVDNRLQLTAVDRATGRLVPLDELSRGTVDQFYFSFRLSLAEFFSSGDVHPPLLLDDSFSQYDDQRLHRALEYLVELAARRQVLLFTCHQRERDFLRSQGYPFQEIVLGSP